MSCRRRLQFMRGPLLWCSAAIAALAGLALPGAASAQEYPGRPIRLVVASSAGSGVDTVGRIVAQRMSEALGAQIFVENRPGAGGAIGVQYVAKAAPDGYTLLMVAPSFTINATLLRKPPYDAIRDFAPVGQASTGHYLVVAHPALPVRNLKELIALARARPGQLNFGSGGNGNSTHLAGEYFKTLAAIEIVHVPYKGSGPAIVDLMSGQIELMFANVSAALSHIRSGRLRVLATSGGKRSLALPDVPTVVEAGIPGYVVTSWFGVAAPARVPQEVVGRLYAALSAAMSHRDMREQLAAEGAEPAPGTPAAFGQLIAAELKTWARVIKVAGVQ